MTGTDGRLVPVSDGQAADKVVASAEGGGPKKPLNAAPPTSQGTRAPGGRGSRSIAATARSEEEIVAALMRRQLQAHQAQTIARRATELGITDKVEELVKSKGYRNPEKLREFLDRWKGKLEGKIQELEDALERLSMGHEVALGGGGADVVDYTTREAIQHKRIFGDGGGITEAMSDAAGQLRGEGGELPPHKFKRIIDVRFDPLSKSPMRHADKNTLRKLFPSRKQLEGVDLVRITNNSNRAPFVFEPPFPIH